MNIGFIGIGNMGGALLDAVMKKESGIYVSDRDEGKVNNASAKGCIPLANEELCRRADLIFLCVKPQVMGPVLAGVQQVLRDRAAEESRFVLVTIAAGLTMETIQTMAGGNYPVIRIMPNIPAAVGEGMLLCTATDDVTEGELAALGYILAEAGTVDFVPEGLIDPGSAVSGCGPAFVSMFIEALADGGVASGLPRDKAVRYAEQTLIGTAKYLMETGIHPGAMKDSVTSPAGSTIEGVAVLEQQGFRSAVMNAVRASYLRSVELGKRK